MDAANGPRRVALVALLSLGCAAPAGIGPGASGAVARLTPAQRARSVANYNRGRVVLAGGAGLVVVGGIFLAFSPLEVVGGSPTGPETIATGIGIAALGTALVIYGARVMAGERARVDVTPAPSGE